MQVQLIVTNKSKQGQAIPVDVPAFRIGQAEGCHLRSNSSLISQQHCVIHTHNGTVTVLDLGGETGTYVNGKRIASQQELKDGDELKVGKHSFVLSVKANAEPLGTDQDETFELLGDSAVQPDTESEQGAEIAFEVRHKGQNVSVTKERLFEMAQKGDVLPDDIIMVAGTKVFADSVHGIVFGNELPESRAVTAAAATAYDPFESYGLEQNVASFPQHGEPTSHGDSPSPEELTPFDSVNEPRVQVDRVPGTRKEITFSDLGKSLEEPLGQASTWMGNNITRRQVTIAGSVLAALCLLGVLVFLLIPDQKSEYGAIRISGILTLDGKPVMGASVALHPRGENSHEAGGMTDKNGRFAVTTGNDPIGRGAVPGDYAVTFIKRPEVPGMYENPTTSGLSLRVEPKGNKSFPFELLSSSVASSQQTTTPQPTTGFFGSQLTAVETASTPPQTPDTEPEPPSPQLRPSFTDIFEAAARGTHQDVEAFVSAGVSVNEKGNMNNTPLHFAARSNPNVAVIQYLVAQRAEIGAGNDVGDTPLHLAARNNPSEAVLQFLVQRTNVNTKNNAGDTPLHLAARNNPNEAVLRFLAERTRADGYARNDANRTPLDVASTESRRRILRNALPPPPSNIGDIFDAATSGTARNVEYYVRHGADVNEIDTRNRSQLRNTPLHLAASHSPNVEALEYLVSQGADVNAKNRGGNTALHFAARDNPNVAVLQYLVSLRTDPNVSRRIDVNARNENGQTPWGITTDSEKGRILQEAGGER